MVGMDPSAYTCVGHDDCKDVPNTFSLPVIVLVLFTILNDGTIISIAYDRVRIYWLSSVLRFTWNWGPFFLYYNAATGPKQPGQ